MQHQDLKRKRLKSQHCKVLSKKYGELKTLLNSHLIPHLNQVQ